MAVDWKHLAIDQLDWHWTNFVRPHLDGLTDDEYLWEPVPGCWSIRRREQSTVARATGGGEWVFEADDPGENPPVTTIAWRLGHIAVDIFALRTSNHFGDGSLTRDQVDWPGTAAGMLSLLDASYDAWMAGVRSLDDEGMARPVGPAEGPYAQSPYAELVLHINREALHHGAEVLLLRDLYRTDVSAGAVR